MSRLLTILVAAVLALLLLSTTVFVVDSTRYALVSTAGNLKQVITAPGLYFKAPPPLQSVAYIDKRLLTLESGDADRFLTRERTPVEVVSLLKWRTVDPRQFYLAFGADETQARKRLAQIVKSALTTEIARHHPREIVANQDGPLLHAVAQEVARAALGYGIGVVDVRLRRVEFPEQIMASLMERMKAERQRMAAARRDAGNAEADRIRADARRQVAVITGDAYRDAERTRGEGEAEAAQIAAAAFGKNPEFYRFYRSLEAYRAIFKNRGDVLVVDPGSDFFRYFHNSGPTAPRK
jgi:membrane protease subunit HflC